MAEPEAKRPKTEDGGEAVDTDLYSRQIYVMGMDFMKKLKAGSALIIGLKGLGVEIAKNVILGGVGNVSLHDDELVSPADLSSQFYLTPEDIGHPRAKATADKLGELNRYCKVSHHTGELTEEFLSHFRVVVYTNTRNIEDAKRVSEIIHNKKGKPSFFILADTRGVFGNVFVDVGPKWTIKDPDGEDPETKFVINVTQEEKGVVSFPDTERHGFDDGDAVIFEKIGGMEELNDGVPRKITVTSPFTFQIPDDTTKYSPCTTGGYCKLVKAAKTVAGHPLSHSLVNPGEFILYDYAKMEKPGQLHIAFQALYAFQARHGGELPGVNNQTDANELVEIAKHVNAANKEAGGFSVEVLDEDLVKKVSLGARGDLNAMSAFFGGIVAHEVLKITHKWTPINQWFYFDAQECLPEEPLSEEETKQTGSRYDGLIAVLGKSMHEKLAKLKVFLVGAGALGCEFLKNFAMMGVGTDPAGYIKVTDMDNIEKSNLNRQFLFRDKDINAMKSLTAVAAAKAMNPDLHLVATTIPVGPDTENTFNDEFWGELDVVVNALDNLKARLYTDSRCVLYEKPLLESGTLGTKANTQVVVPFVTESYASSADPPEKSIPVCTLKNFPNQIEHTIQWAKDLFFGSFTNGAEDTNNFLERAGEFVANLKKSQPAAVQRETLETIADLLGKAKTITFEDCVAWARLKFEDLFSNKILQLLHNFPVDAVDKNGSPFWSGGKRPPRPIKFDLEDPGHYAFLVAAANLYAFVFKLSGKPAEEKEYFAKVLSAVEVPPFVPKSGVKIKASEEDTTVEGSEDDDEIVENILKKLPTSEAFGAFRLEPAHFEKDIDTNFHIAFVTAASNLRARNYIIEEADFQKTKKIAGRIVPAIATTTAMITGLVCLELFKLIQGRKIEAYKSSFVNLAISLFTFNEPLPPAKFTYNPKAAEPKKYHPDGFTLWDKIVIDEGKDLTVKELFQLFKEKYGLIASSIASGNSLLFAEYMPHKDRFEKRIGELWSQINKKEIPAGQRYVDIAVTLENEAGEEVDTPPIRYRIRF